MAEQELKRLDYIEMGYRVRKRREYLEISRESLAERLDVSPQFIADVEYGNKGLSLKNFYALCQVLDVPANYILSGIASDCSDEVVRAREKVMNILADCSPVQLEGISKIVEIYVDNVKIK